MDDFRRNKAVLECATCEDLGSVLEPMKNYLRKIKMTTEEWNKFAKTYDPIKIGSIDGTDCEPHDKAIVRAINSEYNPNKFVKGRLELTIFVSNLNPKTTKDSLNNYFSKYGKLKLFRLVRDIVTGFSKGYAFIEYEKESDAEEAYKRAYKTELDGNILFVDFECERLLKGWKPRRLGGGFVGRKESGQLRFGGRDRPFRKPIHMQLIEEGTSKKVDYKARDSDRRFSRSERSRRNREENGKTLMR